MIFGVSTHNNKKSTQEGNNINTEKKESQIHIRIDHQTKEHIKKLADKSNKSISRLLLDPILAGVNTSVDTQILKKMLKPFIEKGITLELEEKEITRIKQLWEEIKNT